MIPPRIKSVKIIDNFYLEITYVNGEIRKYDMKNDLKLKCYQKLNDINYFKLAKSVETTIEWPDGEDIDSNRLYENSIKIN